MPRFCVVCGKVTNELYDSMCRECYIKHRKLLETPPEVKVLLCPVCYSYYHRGKWVKGEGNLIDILAEAIGRAVLAKSKVNAVRVRDFRVRIPEETLRSGRIKGGRIVVDVEIVGTLRDEIEPYSERHTVPIRLQWRVCPVCLKIRAKKEEAIVQIRAEGRHLDDKERMVILAFIENLMAKLYESDRDAVILDYEIDSRSGGIDLHFTSKRIARIVASQLQREFLATLKESFKVVGWKDGREKTKETIAVRLPPFKVEDVILVGNRPMLVKRIGGGKVYALDLEKSEVVVLRDRDLRGISRVDYERIPGMVLSVRGGTAIIMRMDTYETLELEVNISESELRPGEGVDLIRLGDRLFAIKP